MSDPMTRRINKSPGRMAGMSGFVMALAAAVLLGVVIYISYLLVVNDYSERSWQVLLTGGGIIIAFVFLLLALIRSLRYLISGRVLSLWSFLGAILSGLSLMVLLGLVVLQIGGSSP